MKHHGQMGSKPATYCLEDLGFKSWPEDWLSLLRHIMVSLNPQKPG
jgi:hypothetical protein